MLYIFNNPNLLNTVIATQRVHVLDPLAIVRVSQSTLSVTDGNPDTVVSSITVETSQINQDTLQALFQNPATQIETDMVAAFEAAIDGFSNLPNWSAWSTTDASNYITSQILGGMTQVQADNWVDTNVTSLAGARTAFKQVNTSLIAVRTILISIAQAIIFIRDLIIRTRR